MVRVRELETRLDEISVRVREAAGSAELLRRIADKLALERVRFNKELDFCLVEEQLIDDDLREVRGYRSASKQSLNDTRLQLLSLETEAEDQHQQ